LVEKVVVVGVALKKALGCLSYVFFFFVDLWIFDWLGGFWRQKTPFFAFSDLLGTLSTNPASELDVLGHDGDTTSMDGTQVGVLKESDEVSLSSLLKSTNGGRLEAQISLEVLGDLTNQALEGELADQKLSGLLVATNLTKSDGAGAVAMGLLDSSSGWGRLAGGLGGELLAGGLASSGLAGGLLSTSHLL